MRAVGLGGTKAWFVMPDWGVVVAEPQRQKLATKSLREQDVEYFMPIGERLTIQGGRHHRTNYPLFGRYIMVVISSTWAALLSLRGISGMLLTANNIPAVVDEDRLEHIRAMCINGIYREPRPSFSLHYGQRVTVRRGPLVAFSGIYDGPVSKRREAAIFCLFGREQRVVFKKGELLAA
jgi:transcription antitermination factor NusG